MALKAGRPTGSTKKRMEKLKARLTDDEQERRLNVRMTKGEYKKLKLFAVEKDMTISEVVKASLYEYMSK